jgi:hypothetical protein
MIAASQGGLDMTDNKEANTLIEILQAEKVDADDTGDPTDVAYNTAVDHCAQAAKRWLNGRPAVEGKPLELQTRDELLSYVRKFQADPPQDMAEMLKIIGDLVAPLEMVITKNMDGMKDWEKTFHPGSDDEAMRKWKDHIIEAQNAIEAAKHFLQHGTAATSSPASDGLFSKASDWPGEPGHYHTPDPVIPSEICDNGITTKMEDKCRIKFERRYHYLDLTTAKFAGRDEYVDQVTFNTWKTWDTAWQAARTEPRSDKGLDAFIANMRRSIGINDSQAQYLRDMIVAWEISRQPEPVMVNDLALLLINRCRRACNEKPVDLEHMQSTPEFRNQLGEYRADVKTILDAAGVRYSE